MAESKGTDFSYRGEPFHFELLPDCSVSRHLQTNGSFYELAFLEAIERSVPSARVAFDVGAHIGNHTIFFAKVLGWRVVAFEPNPDAFEKLIANVEANGVADRVSCHQVALSDTPGVVKLARSEPSDAGTVAVVERDAGLGHLIEAQGDVLDAYRHLAGNGPLLLKIDVEGYERQVIEGGSRLLTDLAPFVTTEVQSVSEFEDLADILGESHRPSGVFNPTPTIMWEPKAEVRSQQTEFDVVRYAIRAQVAYNDAHRRNLRARRSLDAVESVLQEPGYRPTNAEKPGLVRLRDQIAGAGEIQALAGKRLLFVVVGESRVPAAALSVLARAVDIIEVGDPEPRSVAMRRYVAGRMTAEQVSISPSGGDLLTAAQSALFIETGDQTHGPVSAAAVIGGEAAPDIADVIVDLLGVPYLHVAIDPIYLPRRLPRIIGASASFVSTHEQLEDWDTRQIVPASTLDPADPLSLVGALSRVVQKPRTPQPSPAQTEHRLLLVSYYSPPAKTVATQRLSYWKDNLASIAESIGLPVSIDWLSATNHAGDGFIYVADRGPFEIPQMEWDRLKSLQRLDLDVIGATWSHYVRESLDRIDESYDAVLISGNPFYYFDLARSFKERWGSRVVLDFRDPWARQERFHYTIDQRAKLMALEDEMVAEADAVISVNSECLDAIAPEIEVPRFVVSNGFDETIVDGVPGPDRGAEQRDGRIRLVYAGTVYATLPLDNLLDALSTERHVLTHFGRDYSQSQAAKTHQVAHSEGLVTYETLIAGLKDSDAGIIMTTGEPTMSTTKIFDYVACELDLIIVTKGRPRTGLLHEMTSDLEGVYWVKDDPEELKDFFGSYRPESRRRMGRMRFSRREQAKQLLSVLYGQDAVLAGRSST